MDGVIELPAEASPLNQENLLRTLQNAVSSQQQQIQSGTSQLQAWETKSGFFTALQDIFLRADLPVEVRMLCLIQLKNGIDKYWRKAATNAISSGERDLIRSRLLQSSLSEQNSNLVTLNAIVTARIARYDYPTQWPDLLFELIRTINGTMQTAGFSTTLSRALVVTHFVVKELVTIRMARSRASFYQIAPLLFSCLQGLYLAGVEPILDEYLGGEAHLNSDVLHRITLVESVLKIIRRVVVSGYEIPHHDSEIRDFWRVSEIFIQKFIQSLHQQDQTKAISVFPLAKQFTKLYCNMVAEHPVSFTLLSGTPDLVKMYWTSAVELRGRQIRSVDEIEDANSMYDWLNLKTLLLLRGCLRVSYSTGRPLKFKNPKNNVNGESVEEPLQAKEKIKSELLTDSFLVEMFKVIISTFFIYIESDLDEWISEPEEWDMKEEGDDSAYEQSVRSCAERLFLDITIHHRELVTQPLLESLETMAQVQDEGPILKDAMFSAIGISAPILQGKLNFIPLINKHLVTELEKGGNDRMAQVIRRRTAILLAQWIGVDIPNENRPLVYQIYEHLLDSSVGANSQIVRITAGKRLLDIVNDWDFVVSQFEPYITNILYRLVTLIRECSLIETKMALLNTVRGIVERLGSSISPHAEGIIQILPSLWDESGDQHLMKQSIVQVLINLVNALKEKSVPLQAFIVPIVRTALEPGSSTQVYLLNDALDLLQAILQQTPRPLWQDLLTLVPLLINVFEFELEHIEKSLSITRSYIILEPSQILQESMRQPLFEGFRSLMQIRRSKIIDNITEMIELLIRATMEIGGETALGEVVSSLIQSRVLTRVFDSIYEMWEANQTTGPKSKDRPVDSKNEPMYLSVLSRMIWASPSVFFKSLGTWAGHRGISEVIAIERLLQEWLHAMDSIPNPNLSKMLTLALTKLFASGQSWIMVKLQELMTLWTSIVAELRNEDEPLRDTMVFDARPEGLVEEVSSAEAKRQSALVYSDPIHTVNIMEYIKLALNEAVNAVGGEQKFQEEWMANVDKDVIKAFMELGIM